MVVMPLGQYIMGNNQGPNHEQPEHLVNIEYAFAVSQNEISVADFELFVSSTDYQSDSQKSKSSRDSLRANGACLKGYPCTHTKGMIHTDK